MFIIFVLCVVLSVYVLFCVFVYCIVLCIVVPLPPGAYPLAVNNNNNNNKTALATMEPKSRQWCLMIAWSTSKLYVT